VLKVVTSCSRKYQVPINIEHQIVIGQMFRRREEVDARHIEKKWRCANRYSDTIPWGAINRAGIPRGPSVADVPMDMDW